MNYLGKDFRLEMNPPGVFRYVNRFQALALQLIQ